jgi:hypothetical protein
VIFLTCLTVSAPGTLSAQGRAVSLDEALDLAEAKSEQVAIARTGIDRASGQLTRARADLFPQLSASASYDRALASEFSGLFDDVATGQRPRLCAAIASRFRKTATSKLTLRVTKKSQSIALPAREGSRKSVDSAGISLREFQSRKVSTFTRGTGSTLQLYSFPVFDIVIDRGIPAPVFTKHRAARVPRSHGFASGSGPC